jgi:hypothetical protein
MTTALEPELTTYRWPSHAEAPCWSRAIVPGNGQARRLPLGTGGGTAHGLGSGQILRLTSQRLVSWLQSCHRPRDLRGSGR